MNIIERQTELGKSLYEINTNTVRELAELSRENVEKYIETNRTFGERLPEVREVTTLMELQREYGETIWNNARVAVETQNDILRKAFESSRDALQTAFGSEATEVNEVAKPKAKAKAKPKAKAKKAPAAAEA